MSGQTIRTIAFVAGSVGAVCSAVEIALKAGVQVHPLHLVALACAALTTFALRWPTDVTASEAKEREARARRDSMFPPGPREETRDLVELVRDVRTEEREP